MLINLMIFNGYDIFVWSAFIFTFSSCFYLFIKTKKEFNRYEKIFVTELSNSKNIKIAFDKKIEVKKEILSGNSI